MRTILTAAFITVLAVSPGAAGETEVVKTNITVQSGGLSVSNGNSDRFFSSAHLDFLTPSGLGIHTEVSGHVREEDAAFVSGGVSYALTPMIRPKVVVGSSTRNNQILPSFFTRGEVQFDLGPTAGLLFTPEINYRKYRVGTEEISAGGTITKYFPPLNDGSYLVGSVRGSVTDVSPGNNTGWEVGGSLIYVAPQFYSFGAEVFGGLMAYDSVLSVGTAAVRNEFVGVRPLASTYASENIELFLRGEYVSTEAYDIAGGSAGVKIAF